MVTEGTWSHLCNGAIQNSHGHRVTREQWWRKYLQKLEKQPPVSPYTKLPMEHMLLQYQFLYSYFSFINLVCSDSYLTPIVGRVKMWDGDRDVSLKFASLGARVHCVTLMMNLDHHTNKLQYNMYIWVYHMGITPTNIISLYLQWCLT